MKKKNKKLTHHSLALPRQRWFAANGHEWMRRTVASCIQFEWCLQLNERTKEPAESENERKIGRKKSKRRAERVNVRWVARTRFRVQEKSPSASLTVPCVLCVHENPKKTSARMRHGSAYSLAICMHWHAPIFLSICFRPFVCLFFFVRSILVGLCCACRWQRSSYTVKTLERCRCVAEIANAVKRLRDRCAACVSLAHDEYEIYLRRSCRFSSSHRLPLPSVRRSSFGRTRHRSNWDQCISSMQTMQMGPVDTLRLEHCFGCDLRKKYFAMKVRVACCRNNENAVITNSLQLKQEKMETHSTHSHLHLTRRCFLYSPDAGDSQQQNIYSFFPFLLIEINESSTPVPARATEPTPVLHALYVAALCLA